MGNLRDGKVTLFWAKLMTLNAEMSRVHSNPAESGRRLGMAVRMAHQLVDEGMATMDVRDLLALGLRAGGRRG